MNQLKKAVKAALREDVGAGDITSRLTIPVGLAGRAHLFAKSECVLAGMEAARLTFATVDPSIVFNARRLDGEHLGKGDDIAVVEGDMRSLLEAERTALNFLQRASGIATLTAMYVERTKGTNARILDTRKTAPGLRALDKSAVRAGGGFNHRTGLFDGILIKDNHIAAAGGVLLAVGRARSSAPHLIRIEVEVTNLDELEEALNAGADVIMLDNMDVKTITEAVGRVNGRVPLEVSGNVSLDDVADIAATGVDFISVGALTHSAAAADISMDISRK